MNKILNSKIRIKAQWVCRRYPELNKQDLIQDAWTLILELKKKYGRLPSLPYLLTAISYHFSSIIRNTYAKRHVRMIDILPLYSLDDPTTATAITMIENQVDRDKFVNSIKNKNLATTLKLLMSGYNIEEIAKEKNINKRTIYRQLETLKKMRKDFEKEE